MLRHLREALPAEALLYVADSGYLPYGGRSAEFVRERAVAVAESLLERGAKALVIACNTATAAAAETLRARFDLPIVAMEPGLKPAVRQTRSGVIGVLATEGTLGSDRFRRLVERHAGGVQVVTRPCPGWVEQVERGRLHGLQARKRVARQLEPLLARGADTLVLGCTHFPFLAPLIREIAGPGVTVVDTGLAVARELKRRLEGIGLLAQRREAPAVTFLTSGNPATVGAAMARLWGEPLTALPLSRPGRAGSR